MEYKLAYVVIVCCLLVHMSLVGTDVVFFHTASEDGALTYFLSQAVAYLLYPLLGWLADVYFTRYKFILFSFITMIVTTVGMVITATLFMIYTYARLLFVIPGVALRWRVTKINDIHDFSLYHYFQDQSVLSGCFCL